MTDLVRITEYAHDAEVVAIHVPSTANHVMGRFEPAQLDVGIGAYLLHIAHVESFERFAQYVGFHVIDERRFTPAQLARHELCDICNKPEQVCQTAAGNRGVLRDHDYVSQHQAQLKRSLTPPTRAAG